jgi:hypothetical protein
MVDPLKPHPLAPETPADYTLEPIDYDPFAGERNPFTDGPLVVEIPPAKETS